MLTTSVGVKKPKLPNSSNGYSTTGTPESGRALVDNGDFGLIDGLMEGIQSAPIVAPPRTTVAEAYKGIEGLLPDFNPVTAGQVSTIDPKSFGQLTGFGDDYYTNLADQAQKRLSEQYFDNSDSLSNQLKNTMNKRGLIGSGIEAGAISDLYKNFGDQLTDFESTLATQRAQNDLDVNKFNIGNELDALLKSKDIETGNVDRTTDAAFKNTEIQNMLAELGLSASVDDAAAATDFDTKMFEQEVLQEKNRGDSQDKLTSLLNDILGNNNIDRDTRDKYEGILAQIFNDTYGYDPYAIDPNAPIPPPNGPSIPPSSSGSYEGETRTGKDGRTYTWKSGRGRAAQWVELN